MNVGALFSQSFMLLATSNVSCASACPNSFTPDGSPVNVFVRISESSLLLSFVRATKYFVSLPVNAIIILPPEIVRPRRYCLALLLLQSLLPVRPQGSHAPLNPTACPLASPCQSRVGNQAKRHTADASDARIPSCRA